jgi:hypothetical protein
MIISCMLPAKQETTHDCGYHGNIPPQPFPPFLPQKMLKLPLTTMFTLYDKVSDTSGIVLR